MAKIVLSYRRDDSQTITSWLFEKLVDRYGKESVFRDIDSIQPTENFRKRIGRALKDCDFVVAVIGPGWEGKDAEGKARIASANDWVRVEVETALQLDIPLLPVLVEDAEMPQPDELPASLREVTEINALTMASGGPRFYEDLERLFAAIDKVTGVSDTADTQASPAAEPAPASPVESEIAAQPPPPPPRQQDVPVAKARPAEAAATAPAAARAPTGKAATASQPRGTAAGPARRARLTDPRTFALYVIVPAIAMCALWVAAFVSDPMSGNSEFLYFAIAMFGMVGLGLAIRRAGMTAIDAVVAGAIIGIATTLCVVVVADVNLEDEGVIVLAVFGGGGIATILAGYVLGALPWNKAPSA